MALDRERIKQIWINQGGDPKWADAMAAVALRESGGRPKIDNAGLNTNGTVDHGLWQVNDIWRKDPVVGRLFQSGAIYTPQGNAKAAVRIMKVQGPQAWASSGALPTPSHVPNGPAVVKSEKTSTRTVPGVDRSALRKSLIAQFAASGGADNPQAVVGLASGWQQAKDTPARTVKVTRQAPEGQPVAGTKMAKGFNPGSPVPGQKPQGSTHPTSGLAGYPAYDYMGPAGTTVVAPVSGKVFKLSGQDPSAGGAPGGPLGYSVYIQGNDGRRYFLTHIDKVKVSVGQRVSAGQKIAVIANGPPSWSSPHVHMGVSG